MTVRSSMQWSPAAAFAACLLAAGSVCAQPPLQLTADELPELGDQTPSEPPAKVLAAARMDLDTPVSRLCADPRAKAVLDSDLPGLTARPEFPFFKNMSLNTLRKMSRGRMTDSDLAKVQAELALLDAPSEDVAK